VSPAYIPSGCRRWSDGQGVRTLGMTEIDPTVMENLKAGLKEKHTSFCHISTSFCHISIT